MMNFYLENTLQRLIEDIFVLNITGIKYLKGINRW
jgi:hypothetical protein